MASEDTMLAAFPSPTRPVPRRTGFDLLADVEIQLSLHFLVLRDRLTFARTSHRLLRVIQAPFALRHATLRLKSTAVRVRGVLTPALLRHVRVTLVWPSPRGGGGTPEDVAALLAFPLAVHELDASAAQFTSATLIPRWGPILAAPAFAELRVLRLYSPDSAGVVFSALLHSIVCLPRLEELHLFARAQDEEVWNRLHLAPALTTLTIVDNGSRGEARSTRQPHIARCRHLTSLRLIQPVMAAPTFVEFCRSLESKLQTLVLDGLDPAAQMSPALRRLRPDPEAFTIAFSALQFMHTLELRHLCGVDAILQQVAAGGALTLLIIRPDSTAYQTDLFRLSMPSPTHLQCLLLGAPKLRCDLVLDWPPGPNTHDKREYMRDLQRAMQTVVSRVDLPDRSRRLRLIVIPASGGSVLPISPFNRHQALDLARDREMR